MKDKRSFFARSERAASRGEPAWEGLGALEPRLMLSATLTGDIADFTARENGVAAAITLANYFDDPTIAGTVVKFDTVMGNVYAELFDVAFGGRTAAPLTVANFLHHAYGDVIAGSTPTAYYGSYDGTIFHRSMEDFVVQGGGFTFPGLEAANAGPTVVNEYSATRSNLRGTIAMAKTAAGPNTATNQFFFNLGDNSANLDSQNGGFTVFGQVLGNGMNVVDAIAALPVFNASGVNSAFSDLPLRNTPPAELSNNTMVILNSVREHTEMFYTVTTDNAALLNPVIDAETGILSVHYMPNQSGTGHVTVRATAFDGTFVEQTFTVNVTERPGPPVVAGLLGPASITRGTQYMILTATGVTDPGGSIARVEFYHDSNGSGAFEPGTDTFLGQDTTGADGYTLNVDPYGWTPGAHKLFARAVDNVGNGSSPVSMNVNVLNNAPVLTSVNPIGTLNRNQAGTLSYDLLAGFANETDANGDPIWFRIDAVSSGTLTQNGLAVVPGVTMIRPGDNVTWTPALNADGTLNAFTMSAWDGAVASARPTQVRIIVNKPPVISSVKASHTTLPQPGTPLTLTAYASDYDGTVDYVEFYRDTNGNGTLDAGDTFLGEDISAAGGWSFTINATGAYPAGPMRFFAVAYDNFDTWGNIASVVVTINSPPVIGALTTSGPVARGAPITLTAADVTDTAPGTVTMVQFYRDLDGDGTLSAGDKLLGSGKRQTGTNTWTYTAYTAGYATGDNKFLAVATDSNGGKAVAGATATVTNAPPVVTSLSTRTPIINRGQTVSLYSAATDPDGTVAKVEFFHDVNGDGLLDGGDTKIGEDASAVGGWTLNYLVPADADVGARRFLARAVDNDGVAGAVRALNVTVNPPPVIGALTTNGPVARGSAITLTATDVTDTAPGTVTMVQFYRDLDGDGTLSAGDKLLGSGRRQTGTNTWTYTAYTAGYATGDNKFLAVATDSNGGKAVAGATATVNNAPPAVTSLTTRTPTINRGATLSLYGAAKDPDGTVALVEFFEDTNGSGVLDAGDTKLGEDADARGGYTLAYAVPGNATPGVHRFFARATDSDAVLGEARALDVTFANIAPTLAGFTATPTPVTQPDLLTLTATGAADADGLGAAARVHFYQDSNGNRRLDAQDTLLGTDADGSDGYSIAVNTGALPRVGYVTLFAQAEDADGGVSLVRSAYVTVKPAPGVDLVMTYLYGWPKTFSLSKEGQSVTLQGTVLNQGTDASGVFSVEALLVSSADGTEYSLGTVQVAALAAGRSLTIKATVYLDDLAIDPAEGTYFLVLRADMLDLVLETNELNNDLASATAEITLVA